MNPHLPTLIEHCHDWLSRSVFSVTSRQHNSFETAAVSSAMLVNYGILYTYDNGLQIKQKNIMWSC